MKNSPKNRRTGPAGTAGSPSRAGATPVSSGSGSGGPRVADGTAKSKQWKVSAAILGAFIAFLAVLLTVAALRDDDPAPVSGAEADSVLVRSDSHVLGEEGSSGVEFVEFLDFECEACLAAYPAIEQLREEYEGEVTFVVRHFPLHFNSERAARAAEAATQQGAFEEMYARLFDTAEQWGHQQEPADEVFASLAEDLGLDMDQYEADYSDSAIAERVARDAADGKRLGVQGTPTFFVDGQMLAPESFEDLTDALDEALAEADQ